MNSKIKAIIIVSVIVILVTASLVAAAALLESNPVEVTPQLTEAPTTTPTATSTTEPVTYTLTLDVNTTTPYVGEAVKLTATISPSREGVTVTFYKNGVEIAGSQTLTDSAGNAEYTTAILTGVLTKTYTAKCPEPTPT